VIREGVNRKYGTRIMKLPPVKVELSRFEMDVLLSVLENWNMKGGDNSTRKIQDNLSEAFRKWRREVEIVPYRF